MEQFINFLQNLNQQERTIKTNIKLIKRILREVKPFTLKQFDIYIKKLIAERKAPSYIKQHISVIRQWSNCFKIEELQNFPYPKIPYRSKFKRDIFADFEVHKFLSLPNPHKPTSIYAQTKKNNGIYYQRYEMWIMFFLIAFYHGLRTIEIARLEVDMIDFGRDVLDLPGRITKTKDPRQVPIAPDVREKLYKYILTLDQRFLFPPFHEKSKEKGLQHIGEADWNRFFRKQLQRMQIKRTHLDPYSTRHTYGSRQAEENASLMALMEIMGHKKLTTTQKYLQTGLEKLKQLQKTDRLRRANLKYKEKFLGARNDIRDVFSTWGIEPKDERRMLQELLNLPS